MAAYTHPLPGSGEPRSVLQTDIELDGTRFTFFVTHLAAWGRLLRIARLRQIATLGDITARGALPHVLVGDFNVTPVAEEITTLLSHGHLRVCGDFKEATFPMTRQRLDYAFCDPRWQFHSQEVIRRGPSERLWVLEPRGPSGPRIEEHVVVNAVALLSMGPFLPLTVSCTLKLFEAPAAIVPRLHVSVLAASVQPPVSKT